MADTENLLIAKVIDTGDFIPLVEQKIDREFFLDPQHLSPDPPSEFVSLSSRNF